MSRGSAHLPLFATFYHNLSCFVRLSGFSMRILKIYPLTPGFLPTYLLYSTIGHRSTFPHLKGVRMQVTITVIAGIRLGHDTNEEVGTGCTVVLCDTPAVGGVDITGGQPVTREIALLYPHDLRRGGSCHP